MQTAFYIGVFCYFGDEVTIAFGTIGDAIYQGSWDEFPADIQKIQTIMMIISQKPFYI